MTNFILYERQTIIRVLPGAPAIYSLETASDLAGVHPDLLRYYCRHGMLGPARARLGDDATFDDEALYELRHIEAYRRRYGVNRQALPLLWELEHEVERLRAELRFLRGP